MANYETILNSTGVFYFLVIIIILAGTGVLFLFLSIFDIMLGSKWPPNMLINNRGDYIENPINPPRWYSGYWELPKSAPRSFQQQMEESGKHGGGWFPY